jgi:FKBP-type peptidyl-prolyl cis-trans isomerase SlyD
MQVIKNTVVSIHYTLKSIHDELIQDTTGYSPETYLHGAGNILAGLEEALNGKQAGDEVEVLIQPTEAFGLRDEHLVLQLNNEELPDYNTLQTGDFIQLPDGREGVILEKNTDFSVVDTNHPLAGEMLVYHLNVIDIRPATEEELQAGAPLPESKSCSGAAGCC